MWTLFDEGKYIYFLWLSPTVSLYLHLVLQSKQKLSALFSRCGLVGINPSGLAVQFQSRYAFFRLHFIYDYGSELNVSVSCYDMIGLSGNV